MGLDRFNFTPCGFCFVIYKNPQDAINAVKYLGDTKLEDRVVQIDLDPGFKEGRQFGRGASGGQVKDEQRFEYDSSRGGFGVGAGGVPIVPIGGEFVDPNLPNLRFGARRIVEKDSYVPGENNQQDDTAAANNNQENEIQEAT